MKYYITPVMLAVLFFASQAYAIDVYPFIAPYSSYGAAYDFFTSATNNVTIEAYIFSSPDIASLLVNLEKSGIHVSILVEGGPVGGIKNSLSVLCALQDSGVDVKLYTGSFRFVHAKYAVADGARVLIATENFGTSGFPPKKIGNKGYGIVADDINAARRLLDVFHDDSKSSKPLDCGSVEKISLPQPPYPEKHPEKFSADNLELVITPLDSAGIGKINSLLRASQDFLYIEQLYIQPWSTGKNPFLEAAIDAARNNVPVRIMMDNSWYNNEKDEPKSNTNTAGYANEIAKNENLDLKAEIYPGNLYSTMHSKFVLSRDYTFISSINWNENSPTNNREIGIIVYSESLANYYKPFFESDFAGNPPASAPGNDIGKGITGFITDNSTLFIILIVFVVFIVVVSLVLLKKS